MTTTKTIRFEAVEKRTIWLSSLLLGGLVLSYVYLINLSTLRAAEREQFEDKISFLRTQVAILEADYLQQAAQITVEIAHERGYRDAVAESTFAARGGERLAVRDNGR